MSEIGSLETYKLENLIADCGGLLGLFMGISFVSILNAFLKLLVNIHNKFKELRSDCDDTEDFSIGSQMIDYPE